MDQYMSPCPHCQSTAHQVKAGRNPSGSQRCQCKVCGKKYTPEPNPSGYSDEVRRQAVLLCLEGQSFRAIGRKLGVNPQSVVNWVNDYVARSSRAIYRLWIR